MCMHAFSWFCVVCVLFLFVCVCGRMCMYVLMYAVCMYVGISSSHSLHMHHTPPHASDYIQKTLLHTNTLFCEGLVRLNLSYHRIFCTCQHICRTTVYCDGLVCLNTTFCVCQPCAKLPCSEMAGTLRVLSLATCFASSASDLSASVFSVFKYACMRVSIHAYLLRT